MQRCCEVAAEESEIEDLEPEYDRESSVELLPPEGPPADPSPQEIRAAHQAIQFDEPRPQPYQIAGGTLRFTKATMQSYITYQAKNASSQSLLVAVSFKMAARHRQHHYAVCLKVWKDIVASNVQPTKETALQRRAFHLNN